MGNSVTQRGQITVLGIFVALATATATMALARGLVAIVEAWTSIR